MGKAVGLAQGTVSLLENGEYDPTAEQLAALATDLGMPLSELKELEALDRVVDSQSVPRLLWRGAAFDSVAFLKSKRDSLEKLRIFLLGSSGLAQEDSVHKQMTRFVDAGAKYYVIWLRDLISTAEFQDSIHALDHVIRGTQRVGQGGLIEHYCERLFEQSPESASEILELYNYRKDQPDKQQTFKPVDKLELSSSPDRSAIVHSISDVAPVGVYAFEGAPDAEFVNIALNELRDVPGGPPLRGSFLFYTPPKAKRLYAAISRLIPSSS